MRHPCRAALALCSLLPSLVVAQASAGDSTRAPLDSATKAATASPARAHGRRVGTRLLVELFAGGALAAAPFDRRLEAAVQVRRLQHSNALRSTVGAFNALGGVGVFALDIGALAIGRAFGNEGLATAGLYGTEAIIVSGVIAQGVKTLAGRQRPYLGTDDSGDFFLGRGMGGGKTSFPSGHATAAFAAATVAAAQIGDRWPRARWVATPLLFGGATMVGFSRMYDSKHWASDVVVGAGIGTISALRILRWNYAHPDNRIARVLGGVSVMPAAGRVGIGWSTSGSH